MEDTLEYEVIYKEELFLVAGDGIINETHLVEGMNSTVDLKKIAGLPFILLRKGRGIRAEVDRIFKNHNFTPNILLETTSNTTAYRLTSACMGIAIVPEMTINLSYSINKPQIYSITEDHVTWDIIIAYRKDAYISNAEKEFFKIAREIFTRK